MRTNGASEYEKGYQKATDDCFEAVRQVAVSESQNRDKPLSGRQAIQKCLDQIRMVSLKEMKR